MVSTGMRPAFGVSASGTQNDNRSTVANDSRHIIPRPPASEFRRLISGPQEIFMNAMQMSSSTFDSFKKVLRDQALIMLDCDRFFCEQNPDIWDTYLQWACNELAPILSKFADAWPVEVYVEHYLSKKIYSKRHLIRKSTVKFSRALRFKKSPSERDTSLLAAPAGSPLGYEEQEFSGAVAGSDSFVVEHFLKTVSPDLSHLTLAFEELGISSEGDLAVIKSWPPAIRKDFFERELVGKINALQIQALHVRLGEM